MKPDVSSWWYQQAFTVHVSHHQSVIDIYVSSTLIYISNKVNVMTQQQHLKLKYKGHMKNE